MQYAQVKVLVVEDEALIRFAAVDALEDDGFVVFGADCAATAIGVIEKHPDIQLIFTDIDMPGSMDGLTLTEFVRDRWPPIKIIVTSGRVMPIAKDLSDDITFVPKPYDLNHLGNLIRSIVR
ncbi:CheY-like chemotaxis protein [Agrobacterium larrymoorei]|uniref:CheY-like chemotaxis protein n=1 Tax=Agrobacterium larrymoorei TaxID=160699 RepID=A0AAJ2B6G7_9HYPH|nr:response regulator [Agrobacterium larrymoorei]MDR6100201.1 CheY-like chemotaxis protein [Agrobacterium larrymoorei]